MTQADRRLAALVEAGIALTAVHDLDALLQRIADLAREVIGARYAAVGVVDEATRRLIRFFYSGIDEHEAELIGELPRGRGVLGILVEDPRPLRLDNISSHPRSYGFPPNHPPMRTFLGVPITVRGRVFGRLYITEKHGGGSFTEDDERLALTLAAQAGVAIYNARLYEESRSRAEELSRRVAELASVERVSDLLISGGGLEAVLQSAVDEARSLTGASRSALFLLDRGTGELVVRAAGGEVSPSLAGLRLPPGTSRAEQVLSELRATISPDLASDPAMHPEAAELLGHPRAGAFAPLVIGGRGLGVLAVYDRADDAPFGSDDLAVLQVLANQAAIAIENDRLAMALKDLAVLEERERISKELHDGVIQAIYSVGLSLQGSLALLQRDPGLAGQRIDSAIAQLDDVVRDVRSYIFELAPRDVDRHGLEVTLRTLVKELEVNTLVETDVHIDPHACRALDPRARAHVAQIFREVTSNIARHAQATQVDVSVILEDGRFVLTVSDDGIGFDPAKARRGRGLDNIEERARLLGGKMTITPRSPRGMLHRLCVPLDQSSGGGT